MNLAPVVPVSIDRAKRLAKALHVAYPRRTLAECQALTAHLLFHHDWHALEKAIKTKLPSAPFDEDTDDDTVAARYRAQVSLVCQEMNNVDAFGNYPPPDKPDVRTLEGLASLMGAMSPHNQDRLEMASCRWAVLHAQTIIQELAPTEASLPPAPSYQNVLGSVSAEWLQELPAVLGRWWKRNIPHQVEVGESLAAYELNPNKESSLLRFGQYWGVLCFYYADTISWGFAMGIAYLVGERYADLLARGSEAFLQLCATDSPSEETLLQIELALSKEMMANIAEFFQVFPRDDFYEVFLKQPGAFQSNAKDCVKILSRPTSRRGTHKTSR